MEKITTPFSFFSLDNGEFKLSHAVCNGDRLSSKPSSLLRFTSADVGYFHRFVQVIKLTVGFFEVVILLLKRQNRGVDGIFQSFSGLPQTPQHANCDNGRF